MPNSSRREFLKTAGQGTLAAGLYMNLPPGAWLTANAQDAQGGASFTENKMECDVLVVGGGWAGLFAAIKAKEQGAQVILVCKGHAGRSGQAPGASGTLVFDPKSGEKLENWMNHANRECEYLNNRYWTETTITNSYARLLDCIAWGLPFKTENGNPIPPIVHPNRGVFLNAEFGGRQGDLPYTLRQHALKVGVKIVDRVMVPELLKQNGRVVGAIGISPDSYEMYTFIAKTTILCVGSCAYKPLAGPWGYQLTGDGEAMAYRAGAEILGKEFVHPATTPKGENETNIVRVGGAANALGYMDQDQVPENLKELRVARVDGESYVDAAGNRLQDIPATATAYPYSYLEAPFAAYAGRAPIHRINSAGIRADDNEFVSGGNLGMSIRNADGLWPADKECRSSVPGLFAAGDALGSMQNGAVYTMNGSSSMGAMVQGTIAGETAAKEAKQMGKPVVSQDEIARAKQFVTMPKERKGGFGPRWVTQLLQNTMMPYFIYYIKKADRLQAALTQIEFMQEHLVPALIARDPHELRFAHETRSMVLSAEIRLRSALFRTESRGNHYREDFPRRDDKNWLAWTKVKPEQGKMTLVKVPIPKEWWPDESIPYEQRYPYRYPGE